MGWKIAAVLCGVLTSLPAPAFGPRADAAPPRFRLATFSIDVTIPLGHRCMGVLPVKSQRIADPLLAHGFVLLGDQQPMVLCAVDWCEIRNGAYDDWRQALADAAGTLRERVLLCALHQHDAPVVDRGAADLLRHAGLAGELYDEAFFVDAVKRAAAACSNSLQDAHPVTHIGLGQAPVERVASNRRVQPEQGPAIFSRGSRSGADAFFREAPEGQIDPYLKTISFWNDDQPLLALHAYATHPMSYYGQGEVSADFVGLARQRRQHDDFQVKQIYVSGCSGDVTAGKYNDGSPAARRQLIERLYQGMRSAWENTRRLPLRSVAFRTAPLRLDFHPQDRLSEEELRRSLSDATASVEARILAAMGLSSRLRVASGQTIDFPCLDLGAAQIVLFPGETFVGYQLLAQQLRPDSFVLAIGYGECWPGYVPTNAAFDDGFHDPWLWTAPGAEDKIREALMRVLKTTP